MDDKTAQSRLNEIEEYKSLGSRLEARVIGSDVQELRLAMSILAGEAKTYNDFISGGQPENRSILETSTEGKDEQAIRFSRHTLDKIKYTVLGVLTFPFSSELSREYFARASIIDDIRNKMDNIQNTREKIDRLKVQIEDAREETMFYASENEILETQIYERYIREGFDEKTALDYTLRPEKESFDILDRLRNTYGVE